MTEPQTPAQIAYEAWVRSKESPERPPTRALQWAMALDDLEAQIHALPHEPVIQHELSVLWEMLEHLRREDQSP